MPRGTVKQPPTLAWALALPSSPPIMQSFVTEKGEQGAMPTRIIEYLQAAGKQEAEAQLSRA